MARVKLTPMVRVTLWAIRIYLLVLLTLIGLKFLRVSQSASDRPASVPVPAGAPAASRP